jgi:hypothetical protein
VPVRLAILCVVLLLADARQVPAGLRCDGGSFVVQPGTRVLSGAPGSYDLVRVIADGRRTSVAIGAACPPVRAHTTGRRIVARWRRGLCGVPERVMLKMALDGTCEVARRRVRRTGSRLVALLAARCASDGVVSVEAGEECAAADACGAERRCVDCRCAPVISFARDVQPAFQNCMTVACHEGARAVGLFELVPERAYEQLLARRARAGACAGQPLVAPDDPDASVLWKRLGGTECGGRMPLGSLALPAADVDAIRAWIAQGAPAN